MYVLMLLCLPHLLISSRIGAENVASGEVHYPPLWHSAPATLADYPLVNDSSSSYRSIDPWYYPHRLGLFKILIEVTTPLMPFCSGSNASNILFALPSQFGWQFDSNRLFTNGTLTISTSSWWASANYYLAVVPFLAAMDVGLIAREPFRIVSHEHFCTDSAECAQQVPRAMAQWWRFFTLLQQSDKDTNDRIIDQRYLAPLWQAYKASISDALPLVESKLAFLPSNVERLFGSAWARLINLIALTRKNTNLYETLKNQQAFLPHRMLLDSDRLLEPNDLPELVNKSLKLLFSFRFDWLAQIEAVWEKLTCNYEARVYAQRTLESMAKSKFVAMKSLSRAFINALVFQCDRARKIDL